ncbi:MAG: tetratricopeptide repeat protein [Deltaproteobacteria bacterium]|nr:tetratricopeptide repeat protein [Deltaproteobacteria bacterium]
MPLFFETATLAVEFMTNVWGGDMAIADSDRWPVTGRQLQLVVCLLLTAFTLAVFWQVQFHDFILYDDPLYVTRNPHVQSGLTSGGLIWALTTFDVSNWHPLTWLSLMLDYHFFRLNPAGYHWTNLIIHIANTILLFTVFRRMTEDIWKSAIVAALFAIHPLHVESVAWISERKDVLSAFFWFLTMGAYIRYTERPGTGNYLMLIAAFVSGLMAKPMLVTLPFVLLLLDVWPLRRLAFPCIPSEKTVSVGVEGKVISWFHAIREKLPLFFLAFLSSVITYLAQMSWKSVGSLEMFSLNIRIANALISYVHYIVKMFWPANLAFFYPYIVWWPTWIVAGAALLLAGLTYPILKHMGTRPYLTVGWLWYLGTLIPVIGVVQVGSQAMADRYTYIPLIGLFMMIAWGVPELFGNWRFRKIYLSVLSGVVLTVLALSSWQQVQYWRNSVTLFEYALSVTSKNYLTHNNLGVALFLEGRTEEAVRHYNAAMQIKPDYQDAHYNIGMTLAAQGKYEEAIHRYREALRIAPDNANTHNNIGVALAAQGKYDEAICYYSEALRIRSDHENARANLAAAMVRREGQRKAIEGKTDARRPTSRGVTGEWGRD